MKPCPLLLLLALLILSIQSAGADYVYFDETTGFPPSESPVLTLKAGRAPFLARFHAEEPEFNIMALLQLGTNRAGAELLFVNEAADTLCLTVARSLSGRLDEAAPEKLISRLHLLSTSGERIEIPASLTSPASKSPLHSSAAGQLCLSIAATDSLPVVKVFEGIGNPRIIAEYPVDSTINRFLSFPVTEGGVRAATQGSIRVLRLGLTGAELSDDPLFTAHTADSLRTRFDTTTDPLEGYWGILDYTTDDSVVRTGGDYTLAMVRRPSGEYILIYVDGAERNAPGWYTGRLKAECTPTRIPEVFHLTWYTADSEPVSEDCSISLTSPRVLTAQLPHIGATLRLHKIPAPR
ncbi:MAG: hypothetical protein HDS66_04170 [Bacteroidales bacterium]|nr:hypothetical protein [Bacteroidales bacterium]